MQSFNFYLYKLVYIHIRGRRLRLLLARAACNQVIPKTQRFCPEAWRALNSRRPFPGHQAGCRCDLLEVDGLKQVDRLNPPPTKYQFLL